MSAPDPRAAAALDHLLVHAVPLVEPPPGELLDPDTMAALGERRLLPGEEVAALDRVRRSPAARVELRQLYPETWAELLGDELPRPQAPVLGFPVRRALAGAATFAAAAAALFFALPTRPPEGAGAQLAPIVTTRGGDDAAERVTVLPGQRVQILMRLGEPSALDRLRGHSPWGALYEVDGGGRVNLVCTSEAGCLHGSPGALAWLHVAPADPGRVTRFMFVSGARAVPEASARAVADEANAAGGGWGALATAVDHAAERHGWRAHPQRPVEVRSP